ncbi:MAG TPA: copper-binding protein [Thermoanaerobaculia bacterium]|nr:copper-binding protein [Thermoanaerobaculia bacterium]
MNARVPLLLLASLLLSGLMGCSGGGEAGKNVKEYTVRGQVEKLPEGEGTPLLGLRHEAIDDYTSRDGRVMGMDAMSMPFVVGDGASLEGVAVGDVIEFKLRVDWEAEEPIEITEIRELPPGTRLTFREAAPPGSAQPQP